jgi:hypothetical protein
MYGGLIAHQQVREASISAVVTRADGSVEDLGIVSYYHKNPLKRWAFAIKRKLKEVFHDRSRSK